MDTEFHLGTGSDAPERPQIKCARIGATRRYLRAGESPSFSRTAKTVAQTLVEPRLRPRTTIAASSRAAIPAGSSEIRAVLCVAVHPFRYLSGGTLGGPPLRMIIDSGIHVGAGSDSAQISTLNPYMVTGKNAKTSPLQFAGETFCCWQATGKPRRTGPSARAPGPLRSE